MDATIQPTSKTSRHHDVTARSENSSNSLRYNDKLLGMIQGHLMGDALGAPHEFYRNRNYDYTGKLEHKVRMMSRFQGTRFSIIGQFTDDGEMTLTLLRSLAASKGTYSQDQTILLYEKWANSKNMGMGINTRKLLYGVTRLKGYRNRFNKLYGPDVIRTGEPESNGSLMRASPLAVIYDNRPTIEDCDITNPTPVNRDASLVYVISVRLALQGATKDVIINKAKSLVQTYKVKAALAHALHKDGYDPEYPPRVGDLIQPYNVAGVEKGKMKGWVLIAFYTAFRYFFYTDSYHQAIDCVIGLGGDTDTNAAITGALCGAFYGSQVIMSNPTTSDNWDIIVQGDTEEGDFPRPEQYRPGDLEELVSEIVDLYPLPPWNKQKS